MQKNIHKIKCGILALLLCLSGCGRSGLITKSSGDLQANSITRVSKQVLIDSLKNKGTFQGLQTSQIDNDYEVVSTSGDEKFYVKDEHMVSSSRKPKLEEKPLIYWRHKFLGKGYRETQLKSEVIGGHEQPLLEIACDKLGTGVIYDSSHETVKRVFYYEAK